MNNLIKKFMAGLFLVSAAFAAHSAVIATVNVGGGNPYFGDYDVVFGYGATDAPTWSQQVASDHSGGGDAFDSSGTASIDITSYFNAAISQSWWVLVDDNWSGNDSFLTDFSINTGSQILTASGTPIFIPDFGQAYAFINTQGTGEVPEPMTIALFGMGLAGVAFARRRRKL